MNTEAPQMVEQTHKVWTDRFWTRIKDRTGLSIHGVLKVVRFADIEQRIQGFEDDPERAADEQITKWRNKYQTVDQAIQKNASDGSNTRESH